MAPLTPRKRRSLASSEFAIPGERKYPIEDKAHARNALARVAQHGTPKEKREVRAAVHRRYPSIDEKKDDPPAMDWTGDGVAGSHAPPGF